MKQKPCIDKNCESFIPPEKAGFSGFDGEPGVMKKNGRCAISGRVIARMKECPKATKQTQTRRSS